MADEDTFQVACPRCGDTFNVPILLLEKKAQCPGCGAKFAMEPPPGPAGRELKARAMRAKEEAASGDTGSVHIPLKGAAKPVSRPSTNTVKLARFKAGAEENNEKLAAVQNQQQSGIHVDQNAIQQELAQNNGSSGHRRTISSGVKAAPAPAKKWWEFWKK
ncbi:MAG: hypothetical protein J6Y92_08070 [Lentisphaeria bacterium]|nr:hypothetical protein [Lentisphaeria bacterium]